MLADPKASSLVTNFAMKWLGLDGLDGIKPDEQIYTTFNDALRQDLVAEAQAFILNVLLENRPDRRAADVGPHLSERSHRAALRDRRRQRRAVPMGDAHRQEPDGTARQRARADEHVLSRSHLPVLRGAWVLGKIIGTPPTPPPPGCGNQPLAARW
jgi:hypothetical protein